MSITVENSTNTLDFGSDTKLTRAGVNALSTPGSFTAGELIATGAGVKFSDGTIQATKSVVPSTVSSFTNDSGYAVAASLATVASTGSYADLSNKPSIPAVYTLPVASGASVGGVKVGSGLAVAGDGTLSTTGGSSSSSGVMYDTTSRYAVCSIVGQVTWVTTTSPVHYGLTWAQAGTALTVNETAHGHIVGDCAIVRNTNVDYQVVLLSAVTANSFTFVSSGAGATSGTSAAYSMGYTFAHNASGAANINAGTLTAPYGLTNVTLLSWRTHLAASTRTGTTYNLTVPVHPAGVWTGMDNVIVPAYSVRMDGTTLSGVGATIGCFTGSNWQAFQLGALPASTTGIQAVLTF